MTKEQIEAIIIKIATNKKDERLKEELVQLADQVEIHQNFFGDQYWTVGSCSIGVAKISTGIYTYYRIKLFIGENTETSKQWIEEQNYLKELERFIDLMLCKIIAR